MNNRKLFALGKKEAKLKRIKKSTKQKPNWKKNK